ncbi:MAG: restriction endonuclease subunit S [Lachnospiraceae bacterium]|nr:restriction endonuclease subunit S [Lachnospiraceae bacterium]
MNDYIAEREQGCLARYENHLNDLTNKADVDIESLEQKVWHEFPLSSLFTITPTSSSIDKINLTKGNGDFPYISRTKRSNGVDSFVDEQQGYLHDKGNCITIGLDTQTVFFQPYDFYTGQNIQILRNEYLNVHTANFILPLLRNLLMAFSWGSQGATLTRLRRSKIMLPINEDNNPDWMYMEQYAHSIKNQKAKDYLQQKRTSKHGNPPY